MRTRQLVFSLSLGALLFAPFGCGKDSAGGETGGSGGSAGLGGGSLNNGGRTPQGTSGSGPTGCEGISPKTGEACDDLGIVCPSQLGSCLCERQRRWECFEIGVVEGGAGGMGEAGAGPSPDGGFGGAGGAGEGGASLAGSAGSSGEGGAAGAAGNG